MIIDSYRKTIEIAVKHNKNNTISLKVSSLCDIEKLRIFNKIQLALSAIQNGINDGLSLDEINKRIVK